MCIYILMYSYMYVSGKASPYSNRNEEYLSL